MMEVTSERRGTAVIVKTEGRVDGSNASDFQDAMEGAIGADDGSVILNLAQLDYISSAGLRIILLSAKNLRQRDVKFAICSLSPSVHELFIISGFDQIIAIHSSTDTALAALEG